MMHLFQFSDVGRSQLRLLQPLPLLAVLVAMVVLQAVHRTLLCSTPGRAAPRTRT